MEMIGALGKSAKKASNVYFFTCTKKELDIKKHTSAYRSVGVYTYDKS